MTYEEILKEWYQSARNSFDEWIERIAFYRKEENWTMVLNTIGNCIAYAGQAQKNQERLDQINANQK